MQMIGLGKGMSHEKRVFNDDGAKTLKSTLLLKKIQEVGWVEL